MSVKRTVFGALVGLVVTAGAADATTWNFAGGGLIGSNVGFPSKTFTADDGISMLTAHAINTEQPPMPKLHQSSLGLGANLGLGDVNQLDNIGDDEAIVFDFGSPYAAKALKLTLAFTDDAFEIWGTSDAGVLGCSAGGLACLTGVSTLLASGMGELDLTKDVSLGGSGAYQYLIAMSGPGRGDGFRVKSIDATPVPLPASALMLLAGIGGLAAAARRKAARAV